MIENPYVAPKTDSTPDVAPPPGDEFVRCKCGLDIPASVGNPGADVRCPQCRRIVRLPGRQFNPIPARFILTFIFFFPLNLALVFPAQKAKKEYAAGKYQQAMVLVDRIKLICNTLVFVWVLPLTIALVAAAVVFLG